MVKTPKISLHTTVKHDLWDLMEKNKLRFNEAVEIGVKIMLADRFIIEEYPQCKLLEDRDKARQQVIDLTTEKIQQEGKDEPKSNNERVSESGVLETDEILQAKPDGSV